MHCSVAFFAWVCQLYVGIQYVDNLCTKYVNTCMKQRKLLQEMYSACLQKDKKKIQKLKLVEFAKINERKAKGKPFTAKWVLADF